MDYNKNKLSAQCDQNLPALEFDSVDTAVRTHFFVLGLFEIKKS